MTFETNGVLPAGFHDYTYDEFCKTFVEDFPTSQRRRMIAEALIEFSREVFAIGVPCEFWIDGSYATAKVNPNDADIILFFQYQHMVQLQPLWQSFRQKYAGVIDIYFWYAKSPENERLLKPADYNQIINQRNY